MASFDDTVIILHYTRYSDTGVVIHTLSKKFGRKSFLVRNATRQIGFFQPLNILDCRVTDGGPSSLLPARDFSESISLGGIRGSMARNAISIFIAEVLFRSTREDADEPGLFDWCIKEICLLDSMEKDYANFHLRFMVDFAAALGFSPSMDDLLPFLDAGEGSGLISSMKSIMDHDYAVSMLAPLSGKQRAELCSRLIRYLEYHLDTKLDIRSLSVLSELF